MLANVTDLDLFGHRIKPQVNPVVTEICMPFENLTVTVASPKTACFNQ